jgi:hypothetical protein
VFSAADAAFSQVRLWQDLNQDGVSQANELFTLADKGIASIGLVPTTVTTNLGNGNTVTGKSVVTRTNNTTTAINSVAVSTDSTAASLTLANNPFYRQFTTAIPLTTTARALPEMQGAGILRDLRESMSLGNAQAAALVAAVQAFSIESAWTAVTRVNERLQRRPRFSISSDGLRTSRSSSRTAWFSKPWLRDQTYRTGLCLQPRPLIAVIARHALPPAEINRASANGIRNCEN